MMSAAELLDQVYASAAEPQRWQSTLSEIARHFGAVGVNVIRRSPNKLEIESSPEIALITEDFARAGYNANNTRVCRVINRFPHPGFLTDADTHSAQELATLPLYTEFLIPRGQSASAATMLTGSSKNVLVFALQGFASHDASLKAVPALNSFRPHLARAMLFGERTERDKGEAILSAFEMCGMPLALIGHNRQVLGANELFRERAEGLISLSGIRMSATEPRTRELLDNAVAQMVNLRVGSTLALRSSALTGEAIIHLMPRSERSMKIFAGFAGFALLSAPGNRALPGADIIAALFDLTVAEARIARMIGHGETIKEVARTLHVSESTVRTHLKSIFLKTSVTRQSELVLLLNKFH